TLDAISATAASLTRAASTPVTWEMRTTKPVDAAATWSEATSASRSARGPSIADSWLLTVSATRAGMAASTSRNRPVCPSSTPSMCSSHSPRSVVASARRGPANPSSAAAGGGPDGVAPTRSSYVPPAPSPWMPNPRRPPDSAEGAPAAGYVRPMADLRSRIEELWARRDEVDGSDGDVRETVHEAIDALDRGDVRVAEIDPVTRQVTVNAWLKQAILLLFTISAMETVEAPPFEYADKLPLKRDWAAAGVRAVPGAIARWGSHIEPGAILMPSFVNIGARVGSGTMVDTWATVGSCAQIGRDVHLAGGVGIGGVLEPPGATPVIVEDGCFIGSRCMVVGGARVR